jgi:hypothetical protein
LGFFGVFAFLSTMVLQECGAEGVDFRTSGEGERRIIPRDRPAGAAGMIGRFEEEG